MTVPSASRISAGVNDACAFSRMSNPPFVLPKIDDDIDSRIGTFHKLLVSPVDALQKPFNERWCRNLSSSCAGCSYLLPSFFIVILNIDAVAVIVIVGVGVVASFVVLILWAVLSPNYIFFCRLFFFLLENITCVYRNQNGVIIQYNTLNVFFFVWSYMMYILTSLLFLRTNCLVPPEEIQNNKAQTIHFIFFLYFLKLSFFVSFLLSSPNCDCHCNSSNQIFCDTSPHTRMFLFDIFALIESTDMICCERVTAPTKPVAEEDADDPIPPRRHLHLRRQMFSR